MTLLCEHGAEHRHAVRSLDPAPEPSQLLDQVCPRVVRDVLGPLFPQERERRRRQLRLPGEAPVDRAFVTPASAAIASIDIRA